MNIRPVEEKDGRVAWRCEVWVAAKRRVRMRGPFPGTPNQQRRAAEEAWRELRADLQHEHESFRNPTRLKVGEYLERWLARKEPELRPKTYHEYEYTVRRYIIPALGDRPLAKVSPQSIQAVLDDLRSRGRAVTATKVRNRLHAAFQDAVIDGLVGTNPVDRTRQPRLHQTPVEAFTLQEVASLLDAAPDRWKHMLAFAAFSGLRISEVLGLKWEDVDLDRGIISISRTVVDIAGKAVLQDNTKTQASSRSMALPVIAVEALHAQRARNGAARSGFVFGSSAGTPTGQSVAGRAFRRIRDSIGLPQLSFHSLRHTFASTELAAGVPLHTVSKRMGHGSATVTARVYGHWVREADEAAVAAVNRFIDQHDVPTP